MWRHHAVFIDNPFVLVHAEEQHRAHAIVEQLFGEIIDGPLADPPSGSSTPNNAWLICIGIAHNLTGAVGEARRHGTGRARTIRRRLIDLAGSTARHARSTIVHVPEHWPWRHQSLRLWKVAHAPPA